MITKHKEIYKPRNEERREGRKEGRRIKSSYLNDIKSVRGEKKKKEKQTTHQEEKFKDIRHSERQGWKRWGVLLKTQALPKNANAKQ